ncbi:hypothetical protein QL093DRAFT_2248266, partial [Fusarium oxysporum]
MESDFEASTLPVCSFFVRGSKSGLYQTKTVERLNTPSPIVRRCPCSTNSRSYFTIYSCSGSRSFVLNKALNEDNGLFQLLLYLNYLVV